MHNSNLRAKIIIDELLRLSIDYFCLAPGSRNTPFTVAIASQTKCRDFVHFDERGLAFHALGYAKVKKKPSPIFITSGSSTANLFPAVVEAYQTETPMMLFTADRPYEERECKSNQTIDQVKFFQGYTYFQQDLPLFDETTSFDFLASLINRAYLKSFKGPVHLNCQFREPFFKAPTAKDQEEYRKWMKKQIPHTLFYPSKRELINPPKIDASKKGIIICGRGTTKDEFEAILELSKRINWPIFTDILAYGRFGFSDSVISHFDFLMKLNFDFEIESVIQFKDTFTSKSLLGYLKKIELHSYQLVSELEEHLDPHLKRSQRYQASALSFCRQAVLSTPSIDSSWLNKWTQRNNRAHHFLNATFEKHTELTEPLTVRALLQQAPANSLFFFGASMPIRYASFFASSESPQTIFSNRGASGIDGNLATAFGISQAKDMPITIVIGDLTLLHDLNSLAQVKQLKHPPTIVILNNSGGGIFSFLPIAKESTIFKRYFQTEHSLTFESIAKQFDLEYFQPKNSDDFSKSVTAHSSKATLIEVQTCADKNLLLNRQIEEAFKACFSEENLEVKTNPL
ncbi:MAG: 2-succinyl-5-enolpyruvyl-6-hydroxy-3-cyclohexene-1-carboxylate synthase [Chlamydiae bacterium]|nr:2-succinyl-5-enolpyruvyl-6-hydroxy-3-cyclohexene-1-carboxylate synthase [Chlamydiota bacterium]